MLVVMVTVTVQDKTGKSKAKPKKADSGDAGKPKKAPKGGKGRNRSPDEDEEDAIPKQDPKMAQESRNARAAARAALNNSSTPPTDALPEGDDDAKDPPAQGPLTEALEPEDSASASVLQSVTNIEKRASDQEGSAPPNKKAKRAVVGKQA